MSEEMHRVRDLILQSPILGLFVELKPLCKVSGPDSSKLEQMLY